MTCRMIWVWVVLGILAYGLLLSGTAGCAPKRVLVRECQDLAGTDLKNCELVRKL